MRVDGVYEEELSKYGEQVFIHASYRVIPTEVKKNGEIVWENNTTSRGKDKVTGDRLQQAACCSVPRSVNWTTQ